MIILITLPIKRKWFDLIKQKIKKEEYRNITPRYSSMFKNACDENNCFWCKLRNGYNISSPYILVYVQLSVGKGKIEWGAEPNTDYFILSILNIKE